MNSGAQQQQQQSHRKKKRQKGSNRKKPKSQICINNQERCNEDLLRGQSLPCSSGDCKVETFSTPPQSSSNIMTSRSKRVKGATSTSTITSTSDRKTRSASNHRNNNNNSNSNKDTFVVAETVGSGENVEKSESREISALNISQCGASLQNGESGGGEHSRKSENTKLLNGIKIVHMKNSAGSKERETTTTTTTVVVVDNLELLEDPIEEDPRRCPKLPSSQSHKLEEKPIEAKFQENEGPDPPSYLSDYTKVLHLNQHVTITPLKSPPKSIPAPPTPKKVSDAKQWKNNQDETNSSPSVIAPMLLMNNLPFMGELTFDTRPRRGRKPKKADICHLISKNYGIHFPPQNNEVPQATKVHQTKRVKGEESSKRLRGSHHGDKKKQDPVPVYPSWKFPPCHPEGHQDVLSGRLLHRTTKLGLVVEEPLNLCVRDGDGSPKQRRITCMGVVPSSKNYGEMNLKMPLVSSNLFTDFQLKSSSSTFRKEGGCGGGVGRLLHHGESHNRSCPTIALGDHPLVKLNSKSISERYIGRSIPQQSAGKKGKKLRSLRKEEGGGGGAASPDVSGSLFGHSDTGPNSGAQVSICKFKFTGGAKPSLQEKKMLSLDSGGNFRFYTDKDKVGSGGDQYSNNSCSNHQQTPMEDCSYAYSALPKSAKSMSVCMPVVHRCLTTKASSSSPVRESPLQGQQPAAQPLDELDTTHGSKCMEEGGGGEEGYSSSGESSAESSTEQSARASHHGATIIVSTSGKQELRGRDNKLRLIKKRTRRTRKSVMREKLEKTFKEKGFLIQTQQLESAEGATYCKFRQLRKFTRYLFRSWKDYLPDNVRDINKVGASGSSMGEAATVGLLQNVLRTGGGGKGAAELDHWTTSLSSTTTNPFSHQEQQEEEGEEEDLEDDEGGMRMELVPEVTLITQPSSSEETDESLQSEGELDVENIDSPNNVTATTKGLLDGCCTTRQNENESTTTDIIKN